MLYLTLPQRTLVAASYRQAIARLGIDAVREDSWCRIFFRCGWGHVRIWDSVNRKYLSGKHKESQDAWREAATSLGWSGTEV